ncbi:MAG: hypothetical protein WDM89_12405 [Rhizomicrobium sp.]
MSISHSPEPSRVERNGDLGLACLAFDGCSAHGAALSDGPVFYISQG